MCLASNVTKVALNSGCNFWLEWFGWINGTWGICQTSRFGDGGPDRCSRSPKPSLEKVFYFYSSLKSPFLRGVNSLTAMAPYTAPSIGTKKIFATHD